jgi:hypothetical protein
MYDWLAGSAGEVVQMSVSKMDLMVVLAHIDAKTEHDVFCGKPGFRDGGQWRTMQSYRLSTVPWSVARMKLETLLMLCFSQQSKFQ